MIARHGVFQLLDGVSFGSRQPLFANETRLTIMNLLFRVAKYHYLRKAQFNCIAILMVTD
ncbi:hypothetical protein T02_3099 [Trichinella nativa]|uniref:Uncharacterized protein n=1 Tax=Trichinella nativa TaxID=6335 RepID=A0A0V1KJW0_9BILA|nr:hypothetical protein T02_3099 [Trichinella nativa]